MAFLRVVEVLPPLFPVSRSKGEPLGVAAGLERFTEGVRSIRDCADVFLVANVKNPSMLKLDTVQLAASLQESLGVEAAPVIVVRDQNRLQFLSTVLTALSVGLKSMMIAWGDDYLGSARVSNVRDFEDLAGAIREASLLRARAGSRSRFLAPVDVDSLAYPRGVALAKGRLRAGADILLAQPPTTDAAETFDRHAGLVVKARMGGEILLGVFPFKNSEDVKHYQKLFGWKIPRSLHDEASKGEEHLNELGREVVGRLRKEGWPGVYVATRGSPGVARALLS